VDGKRVVGHGGGAPGMIANLDMYWDSGYTVIVLANRDPRIADQLNGYIENASSSKLQPWRVGRPAANPGCELQVTKIQ
jgi:hypothetical protein